MATHSSPTDMKAFLAVSAGMPFFDVNISFMLQVLINIYMHRMLNNVIIKN